MIGIIGEVCLQDSNTMNQVYFEMLEELARRQPNQKWIFERNNTGLGICKTTQNAVEPMIKIVDDKQVVMVCDGEIYNAKELSEELKQSGYEAKNEDELFLMSYLCFGNSFLEKINGVFALAIYDERIDAVFIARDRMGIRPLFYVSNEKHFLFASEMKGLLKHPEVNAVIDKAALNELFCIGPGRTLGSGLFKGIMELEPATCGYLKEGKLLSWKYWELKDKPWVDDLETTKKKVKDLVIDAIQRQIPTTKKSATFLSGGLDSSLVSKVMADELAKKDQRLTSISVEYQDNDQFFKPTYFQPNSDNYFIDVMRDNLGSNHTSIIIHNETLADELFEAMWARDLPGMADVDSSLYLFCKEAKEFTDMALTGECADEIFGGYPWYRDEELLNAEIFPWAKDLTHRLSFLKTEYHIENPEEFVKEKINKTKALADVLPYQSENEVKMKQMMKMNLDWFMMCLVDRGDRLSRASLLDLRIPFCDYRIVEMLYTIPWEMKNLDNREKGLLREAVEDMLPNEIVWRKKSPYPKTHHPEYWNKVKCLLREIIEDEESPLLKFVVKERIESLLKETDQISWYGQLMTTPQTIAYFIQMNMWLKHYNIKFEDC